MNHQLRFEGAAPRQQTIDAYDGEYAAKRGDVTNVSAQSCMKKI